MSQVILENGNTVDVDNNNFISVDVLVSLNDILGRDFEEYLDLISEKATGSDLLSDITYEVVGFENGQIKICVKGNVDYLNDFNNEESHAL